MALYKVIGNYYSNVLDYINIAYLKNGKDFNRAYDSLNKTELINLMADTMVRVDMLQESDLKYWNSQRIQAEFYIAILSIVLALVLVLFIYFFKLSREEMIRLQVPSIQKVRTIIVYVIVYFIIFSAIFLLIWNIKFSLDRAKTQIRDKNPEDFRHFNKIIASTNNGDLLVYFLKYIGYIARRKKSDATRMLKLYERNNRDGKTPVSKRSGPVKEYYDVMIRISDMTLSNEVANFGLFNNDLKECLRSFFSNGRGYYNLKVKLVSQSNVYTLRETRRVLNYYYFLVLKKSTQQNIELAENNRKITLQEKIIDPILETGISTLSKDNALYLEKIDSIATELVPYQIDIPANAQFISQELQKKTPGITATEVDFINEMINRLAKTIYVKQQTSLKNLVGVTDEQRYLDPSDFIYNVKDMTYIDFEQGFEIEYLKEIVDEFYRKISAANNSKNIDDIYYEEKKAYDVYQKFMILFFAALIMCFGYYLMLMIEEFKQIKAEEGIAKENAIKNLETGEKTAEKVIAVTNVNKEFLKTYTNWGVRLMIPFAAIIFIIALIYSYYLKKRDVFFFNRDMIEANTSDFKESIHKLNSKLIALGSKEGKIKNKLLKIDSINEFSDEDKFEIFALVKNVVDKYEKCNYIMEAAKNKLPFPYTEIIMDIFMIIVLFVGILYITSKLKPAEKIRNIKRYNAMSDKLKNGINDPSFKKSIDDNVRCHEEDMDAIVYTLKIIVFMFIFIFLIFYTTKILASSSEFKMGLYNSSYFEESRCYG